MFYFISHHKYRILGGLAIGMILVWLAVFTQAQTPFLEVDFFDIGQGDAIFIEAPNGNQVLIDGGPDETILEKLGQELSFYDRSIDLVILTHPEADHINGLVEVLKNYQVEHILYTGVTRDTSAYQEWSRLISQKGIPFTIAQAGQVIYLSPQIKLVVLWPSQDLSGQRLKNNNNASIVFQLVYGQSQFLFTGDIEKETERELANSGIDLVSDVLKVAHHGSKTSTTEDFLSKVNPKVAVISAGRKNPYGHPHQSVIERLEGVKVYGTYQDGDIEILSDGQSLLVRTSE